MRQEPGYSKSEWLEAKASLELGPFPDLPYLLDGPSVSLTQHQTIGRYLARELGLDGGQQAAEMQAVSMAAEAAGRWRDALSALTERSHLEVEARRRHYMEELLPDLGLFCHRFWDSQKRKEQAPPSSCSRQQRLIGVAHAAAPFEALLATGAGFCAGDAITFADFVSRGCPAILPAHTPQLCTQLHSLPASDASAMT